MEKRRIGSNGDKSPSPTDQASKKQKTIDFASGQGLEPKGKGKETANVESDPSNPDQSESLMLRKVNPSDFDSGLNKIRGVLKKVKEGRGSSELTQSELETSMGKFRALRGRMRDAAPSAYHELTQIRDNPANEWEKSVAERYIYYMTREED